MPKKTKKNTTRKNSVQNKGTRKKKKKIKTGMISYRNNDHPKHLKLDKFNMDCASQVFQLLKFTDMKRSAYLQRFTKLYGLHYDVMKNILNDAYPNNNFKWIYIPRYNLEELNNYLQPNQGTVLFIDASSLYPTYDIVWKNTNSYNSSFNQYDNNTGRMYKEVENTPISHYVAMFRKNKKGTQNNNYFIRDPQERTNAYSLPDFLEKWDKYNIYILVRDNSKEELKPYGVTQELLYHNLFNNNRTTHNEEPSVNTSNLSTLFRSGINNK
jgi:hypothetical protein